LRQEIEVFMGLIGKTAARLDSSKRAALRQHLRSAGESAKN